MKKSLTLALAAIMMTTLLAAALCTPAAAATDPLFFWDFKESFPEVWNEGDFLVDGAKVYSADGNIVLAAKDGDGATNHLQVFVNTEDTDQGGNTMKACSIIAVRFKLSRTEVAAYAANVGFIGYDGQEKYIEPEYENTADMQTWYLDFSGDWTKDAHYIVWYWHKAANFWQNVEIEFMGGFTTKEDAEAYINNYDNPPVVTDPPTTEEPAKPTDPVNPDNPDNPETGSGITVVIVSAVIISACGAVYIAGKNKKRAL